MKKIRQNNLQDDAVDFTKFSSNVRITELFGDLFWKAQCALALHCLNPLGWQNGAKLKNVGLLQSTY